LGGNGYLEIHRDGTRDEFSIRTNRERGSAFRDQSLLAEAGRLKPRLFKTYPHEKPSAHGEEFISVEPSRKRKRKGDEEGESGSDYDLPSYRSIEGKADPQDDLDSAFESDNDDSDWDGDYMTATKKRSWELSRIVREHPEYTQAWLDLIELQDVLFWEENDRVDHVLTRDESKALADIKLSMYQKALSHARSSEYREKTLVSLMREGRRVWSSQKLAKEWNDITTQNPESFALWRARMDFELGNISTFSYEAIKKRFIARLRFLQNKLLEQPGDEEARRDIIEQAVYVFLRLTRFLHTAGFTDLAVGAWQAMLELHFARPDNVSMTKDQAMSSFGQFWESEVPRLGERGATGWRKFAEDGNSSDLPDSQQPRPRPLPATRDAYKAWAATERHRVLEARMPARTVDEGIEEDPYRVVMFRDLEELLLYFSDYQDRNFRTQLLDAFLLFCGLPPAFGRSTLIRSALTDPSVYAGSKDFEDMIGQISESPATTERHKEPPRFKQDGSFMVLSSDVLVTGANWFSYLQSWCRLYPIHDEPVERSYILTGISQLVRLHGVEGLGEYYLALEWLNNPSDVRKTAKSVLKQCPSNPSLYNVYALIEWANGNNEAAQKVLTATTSQSLVCRPYNSAPPRTPTNVLDQASGAAGQMLRNTWAWIELEGAQKTSALRCLCSSLGKQHTDLSISLPSILKVKAEAFVGRDTSMSGGKVAEAVHYAIGLALLNYLAPTDTETVPAEPRSTDQGEITSAMATVSAFSANLSSRGREECPLHEQFLQFAARLLYYHATHGPFRPIYVRSHLERFITLFPRNTIFLSLFAWAETSLRIDDPVRSLLRDRVLIKPHDAVSSRVFAIMHELDVGTVYSAQAAFESAVSSEACRGSAKLWLYYVRFCRARKELRTKVKDVFYRAIAACPGTKELYMEAFTMLAGEMGSNELRAVFSTLETKGLRVHVDLVEFVGKWQAQQKERAV
jgi:hypothetical protein